MKALFQILTGAVVAIALLPYLLFRQNEMPSGTNLASPAYAYDHAELLIDQTIPDAEGNSHVLEHQIFDRILEEIEAAETFIIADFFLWNPWKGSIGAADRMRPLATELADALIAKRIQNPDIPILILTDPINRIYGDQHPEFFDEMAASGIPILYTDLEQLRDSNLVYAPLVSFWSKFFDFNSEGSKRWFPNLFDPPGELMTTAQLQRLLYFKANHRKVLITGRGGRESRLVISSLNPSDGSANHSNLGLLVDGPVAQFAADSELEIARWSSKKDSNIHAQLTSLAEETIYSIEQLLDNFSESPAASMSQSSVAYRSEEAIRNELLLLLQQTISGTKVDIGLFYLSDRKVIDALKMSIERGAIVRLLLDANRDAFGREKNGIPNRMVAAELMKLSETHDIQVRWAATNGEQFHGKFLRISDPQKEILFLGSANWTRRNLANLNLESNILLNNATGINREFDTYFDAVWENRSGLEESLPYEAFAEGGWSLRWKTWLYRIQEWSGASVF